MDLLDPLLDPWRSGITRHALAEVALLAAICGPLAFWVVSEHLSYAAESLAHGMLPGLVLAVAAGVQLELGAAGAVMLAAALIAAAGRDDRIGADTATAVVVTGMLGAGALLALAPETPRRLEELLFGDPLAASNGDLAVAACFLVAVAAALAALHRPLAAVALDPDGAAALGVRVGLVRLTLLGLVAAATAVAARGLGSLLVLALLVAPGVAVRRHTGSSAAAMLAAALAALVAGVMGVYVSYYAGSAAGASVALALTGVGLAGAGPVLRRA